MAKSNTATKKTTTTKTTASSKRRVVSDRSTSTKKATSEKKPSTEAKAADEKKETKRRPTPNGGKKAKQTEGTDPKLLATLGTAECKFAFPLCKGSLQTLPRVGEEYTVLVSPTAVAEVTPYDIVTASVVAVDDTTGLVVVQDAISDIRVYLRDVFPNTAKGKAAAKAEADRRLGILSEFDKIAQFSEAKLVMAITSKEGLSDEELSELSPTEQTLLLKFIGKNPFSFLRGLRGDNRIVHMKEALDEFRENKTGVQVLRKKHLRVYNEVKKAYGVDALPTENDFVAAICYYQPVAHDPKRGTVEMPSTIWKREAAEQRKLIREQERAAKEAERTEKKAQRAAEREAKKAERAAEREAKKAEQEAKKAKSESKKTKTSTKGKPEAPVEDDYVRMDGKRFKVTKITKTRAYFEKGGKEISVTTSKLVHAAKYKSGRHAWEIAA